MEKLIDSVENRIFISECIFELCDSANESQFEKYIQGLEKLGMPVAAQEIRNQLEFCLKLKHKETEPVLKHPKELQLKRFKDAIFNQRAASYFN